MERVTSYVEARHFCIGDLYAFGISVAIEFATDRKPFFCRRVGDQRDCDVEADERHGAPVLGDEAEHAMLDLVPLGSARRIVANLNDQAGFVGELLQRPLPEPQAGTIGAAAMGGDHEAAHPGITRPADPIEPEPNAVDSELP